MLESTPTKPLPVLTEENRPFWEGCRNGKLLLQQCSECHHYQFYPRLYCMHCNSDILQWVEASGRGTIYSYTIIHQNKSPEFVHDTPYNVALVQLDEGPRLLSNIVDIEVADLKVDLLVAVVFDQVNETFALPRFRPVREGTQANQK
jgi:uncharacterized OB-fold protein